MKKCFISHAFKDIKTVLNICNKLEASGIPTWASFKDIPAGIEWNKAIESAIDESDCLILFISPNSVESTYVQAEVEYALNERKKVIPILIEEAKIPLRWYTLQYINLTKEDKETQFQQLLSSIPQNSLRDLQELLEKKDSLSQIKKILNQNPSWVSPAAKGMVNNTDHPFLSDVDFFDHYGTSGGWLAHLFFYCTPQDTPFSKKGKPSIELESKLKHLQNTVTILANVDPFSLSLSTRLALEEDYLYTDAVIVAGRTHHYSPNILKVRRELMSNWGSNVLNKNPNLKKDERIAIAFSLQFRLNIISYDQVIEFALMPENFRRSRKGQPFMTDEDI